MTGSRSEAKNSVKVGNNYGLRVERVRKGTLVASAGKLYLVLSAAGGNVKRGKT